jgi:hypothetical protein
MTVISFRVTFELRYYRHMTVGMVKFFLDVSILSFLTVGGVIHLLGRDGFASKSSWVGIQYFGMGMIAFCCIVIFVNLAYSIVVGVKASLKKRRERKV